MFERPTGPRSGSLEKRQMVHSIVLGVSGLNQNLVQNLTAKELRESIYELEKATAIFNRNYKIRLEQSHV